MAFQRTVSSSSTKSSSTLDLRGVGAGIDLRDRPASPAGSRQSGIAVRNFFIGGTNSGGSRQSSTRIRRSSTGGGVNMSPGVVQQLSQAGITGFKGEREKEKMEMQNLNERLGSYIEKVHFLSAENQRLEAENEALRNRKSDDLQPIRDAYENELAQARNVIDQLSTKEGVDQVKLKMLNDDIARQNEIINTYELQQADYRNQLAVLQSQVCDLEAELASLRARLNSRDDEAEKARALISKYQDQMRGLREDLDAASVAHIEAECLAQTKGEEASFYKDLLDQLELMKPEPVKIKGMDAAEFWQSHMKKAIRDIQQACDEKVSLIQQDCEAKFASQVSAIKAGSVKDNVQLMRSTEEVNKLRSQLGDLKNENAQLAQRCALLQSERDHYAGQIAGLETELDEMRLKYERTISGLEAELAGVMEQLRVLTDAKLSMELEIACYKKLLEGEESRNMKEGVMSSSFRSMTEGSSSSHMGGSLSQAVHQQSMQVPVQQPMQQAAMSATFALPAMTSASSLSVTSRTEGRKIQRWNKGSVCFGNIDHSNGSIGIENEGGHPQAKAVNLEGWKLQKKIQNGVVREVTLKKFNLTPNSGFTVWGKGAKSAPPKDTQSNEMVDLGLTIDTENCVWVLLDTHGEEKATLTETFL